MSSGGHVDHYRYPLDASAIAQEPAEPREAARLLDTRTMVDHHVSDLPNLLEPGDVVVVNNTRVRAARLAGRKETGGSVELLLLRSDGETWECLVRPARRVRPGTVISVGDGRAVVRTLLGQGRVLVSFDEGVDVEALAREFGAVPLPPYITGSIAPDRYQTVYADRVGSAAAPTAGLHLTESVLARLAEREIAVTSLDLEVGLGTFRPITAERIDDHDMHAEDYTIPDATADLVNEPHRRVVAIGTTVVRALESAAGPDGMVAAGRATTSLFIRPGFRFQVVDLLMTNFHVPGSSLVVMVAAFMGPDWRKAYAEALQRGYRFLSFGDAMVCERR